MKTVVTTFLEVGVCSAIMCGVGEKTLPRPVSIYVLWVAPSSVYCRQHTPGEGSNEHDPLIDGDRRSCQNTAGTA